MSYIGYILEQIQDQIERAEQLDAAIRADITALESAGMYPAVPAEQWQTRPNGQSEYLYLIFKQDERGNYTGPGGKRKLYIGADQGKIDRARQMVANRVRFEQLHQYSRDLKSHINNALREVEALDRQAGRINNALTDAVDNLTKKRGE